MKTRATLKYLVNDCSPVSNVKRKFGNLKFALHILNWQQQDTQAAR